MTFEHYRCQTVWMVDSHNRQTSGAVWFKHKYLTHPSVTPADRITAAIGGLAKTLTTGVPPQLRDDTLDKLKRLQNILAPTIGEDSRGTTNEHALPPRVQIHPQMRELAPPPRVPTMPSVDKTEFVLPPMWQRSQPDTREPPTEMTKQQPQRSRRIAEKTEKIRAHTGHYKDPVKKRRYGQRDSKR